MAEYCHRLVLYLTFVRIMNKNKQLTTKCSVQHRNKNIDNNEEAPVKKIMKLDRGSESPQYFSDSRVSGYSTPIRKKVQLIDLEDSPELDYHYSPISLPCTQEGGNEIAWDWQISAGKNSSDKAKLQTNQVETPKRTKQLQKKRNSNSPLLQKPLKRKQVKMENIENIGKLTAELKALSERMKSMQQSCETENHNIVKNDTSEEEHETVWIDLCSDDSDNANPQVCVNNDKLKVDTIISSSNNKKDSNYEDLFDDSIDDSMIKCTQEIEEKLNLCKGNGNDAVELLIVNKEKDLFSVSENEASCLTTSSNSSISKSSSLVNSSGCLKTYSNNLSKVNFTSNISVSSLIDSSFQKSYLKNNVINAKNGKCVFSKLQKEDVSKIPDDSFDDCLATCMEDDKLMSKLSEYDFNVSNADCLSNSRKVPKKSISNIIDNKQDCKNFAPKAVCPSHNNVSVEHENPKCIITNDLKEIDATDYKEAIVKSFADKTTLESRKFFKTKSLSDHFYQTKTFNSRNKKSKPGVSPQKRFPSNSGSFALSTTPIVKGQNLHEKINNVPQKAPGNCFVKHKSTSNLCSTEVVAKESQPIQCTPEEIEKKRLEAKMKLESKRKLQQNTKVASTRIEIPTLKSVKR
ncbi:uncharacterized protein LOC122398913 [Colletes gigas]|uniref:uncharacterized protein LOC122398913 n=1 Tax=Colletes gigas TaxID=935657 RepID=UPI001C9ACC9D|nr:uncharacterized protein LOC122398913 [Colletes gigas]